MASDEERRPEADAQAPTAGVTSRGIWSLAWPTMLSMGTFTIVRMTDFAMVGDLGPEALAAVGVGGQFYWLLESLVSLSSAG